ncbi:MAG: ABC transporter permease [Rhizobiales bacterium]|nr:ABC transporter permease [Hyphomicrobiales bacterium]
MQSFVLGRVLQAAFIIFFIAVSVFLILRLSAGDPARIRAPVFARPDVIEQYRKDFGTDRPIVVQLGSFFAGIAKGDLGNSFRFQEPVVDLIARALPKTLLLAAAALAISLTLAVVLGSMAALRPNSFWGWLSSALAAFGQAAPVFWFGVVLVLIFSITLKWFPAGGFSGPSSLVLPAIAVSLSILPTQLRVLRASMEATLRQDSIRNAHALGLR